MRLKSSVTWALVLAAAFIFGYVVMRAIIGQEVEPVQNQEAPAAP